MAIPVPNKTYQRGQDMSSTGSRNRGVISTKLSDFYQTARGHLPNRYEVYLYGPYVEEALRILDRNSYSDKYVMSDVKVFPGTFDSYKKSQFNDWFVHSWNRTDNTLCMRWNAQAIDIPGASAKSNWFMMDSTKSMEYPVITANNQPKELSLTVLDDSYMMWYQFFNALYNVQFSPLVLKPRSTMQKINMYVNAYYEAITIGRSHDDRTFLNGRNTDKEPVLTDLDVGQMFEFNSCVLMNAPEMRLGYGEQNQYQFTVRMQYPNSFQGTFKKKFRYLRDNTTKGVDVGGAIVNAPSSGSPYGEYNKAFYETPYNSWQASKSTYRFEAYNPNDYKRYMSSHPAAFRTADKYNYDMHDAYRK